MAVQRTVIVADSQLCDSGCLVSNGFLKINNREIDFLAYGVNGCSSNNMSHYCVLAGILCSATRHFVTTGRTLFQQKRGFAPV